MMILKKYYVWTPVMALIFSGGLAGGHTRLIMPHSKYPVSMSNSLEQKQDTLARRELLTKVGELKVDRTAWGMVWSLVSLTPKTDLSDEINQHVDISKGDGITNLSVKVTNCALNFVPFLAVLPFWPGCSNLTVFGDVVKYVKE
jgi:hypothetical protein